MAQIVKITLALLVITAPVLRSACICCASVSVNQGRAQSPCCESNEPTSGPQHSVPSEDRAPCSCPIQLIETTECRDIGALVVVHSLLPCFDPSLDESQQITPRQVIAVPTCQGGERERLQAAEPICAVTILHEHLLL